MPTASFTWWKDILSGGRRFRRGWQSPAAGDEIAVADIARAECLIGPLKHNNAPLLGDYRRFFASPIIRMLPMTPAVCERAAEVRIKSGMSIKLPDALHLAAAIEHGCGCFLTNDTKLARCTDITVEILT